VPSKLVLVALTPVWKLQANCNEEALAVVIAVTGA